MCAGEEGRKGVGDDGEGVEEEAEDDGGEDEDCGGGGAVGEDEVRVGMLGRGALRAFLRLLS